MLLTPGERHGLGGGLRALTAITSSSWSSSGISSSSHCSCSSNVQMILLGTDMHSHEHLLVNNLVDALFRCCREVWGRPMSCPLFSCTVLLHCRTPHQHGLVYCTRCHGDVLWSTDGISTNSWSQLPGFAYCLNGDLICFKALFDNNIH